MTVRLQKAAEDSILFFISVKYLIENGLENVVHAVVDNKK